MCPIWQFSCRFPGSSPVLFQDLSRRQDSVCGVSSTRHNIDLQDWRWWKITFIMFLCSKAYNGSIWSGYFATGMIVSSVDKVGQIFSLSLSVVFGNQKHRSRSSCEHQRLLCLNSTVISEYHSGKSLQSSIATCYGAYCMLWSILQWSIYLIK